ncbi:Transformer-2 protein-like protein [Smittium mucronatum]|uniref:Transformer-2 protein-like protein n=1 Tax=Smittium mucronatum TaxID=133383 RepID=A0A1R0H8W1_9FUNG|nr:Transformer-2 protein-like protein [Smittium mucronatum]
MNSPIITSEPLSLEPDIIMSAENNDSQNFGVPNDEGIRIKNSSENSERESENPESGWGASNVENDSGWNTNAIGGSQNGASSVHAEPQDREQWNNGPDFDGGSRPPAPDNWKKNNSRSRSRERSFRPRRSRSPRFRRGHNKDPMNRERPDPSNVLGVFGLSMYTKEDGLDEVFSKYGRVEKISIVYDKEERSRSRGYGFVTMATLDSATDARNQTNGMTLDGRKIRVDYSLTQKPHSPLINRDERVYRGPPIDRERGDRFGSDGRPARDRFNGPERSRPTDIDRGYRGSYDRDGPPDLRRDRSPPMDYRRRNERSRSLGRGGFSRPPQRGFSPQRGRAESPRRFPGGNRRQELYRIDREPERGYDRGPDRGYDRGMDRVPDRGPDRGMERGGYGGRRGDRNPHFDDRNMPFDDRERRDRDRSRGRGPPLPSPPQIRGRPMGYERSPPYNNAPRAEPMRGRSPPPRRPYGQGY